MNGQAVIRIAGKAACFLGIAVYFGVALYMFVLRDLDLSKHPEDVYFALIASGWGALPFLLLWLVRRKMVPFASDVVVCLGAVCMVAFELWTFSSALRLMPNNPGTVGEAMMNMPISLWPVSIGAILLAEIRYRWRSGAGEVENVIVKGGDATPR